MFKRIRKWGASIKQFYLDKRKAVTPTKIYTKKATKAIKRNLPPHLKVRLSSWNEKKIGQKAGNENNQNDLIVDLALTDPAHDKFGRDEFAKRIANILISKSTPDHLTVAIYGKWGDGKTSVINFIKHFLNKDKDRAVYIDFNPWRYKDDDLILNSFFKQFAQGITHKLGADGKQIAKTILSYSGLIVALAEPITGLAMFTNSGVIGRIKKKVSGGKDFVNDNDFSPAINSLEKSLKQSESLEKQKQRISRQLDNTNKKFIVFIDDIDRLSNQEIQILFSLLKVTADFNNVVYVLGFDPEIVARALDQDYQNAGFEFLEKIIQVPLHLPKSRQSDLLEEILYPHLNSLLIEFNFALTADDERRILDSISNGLKDKINTPRMVKRYLNTINFALPILKDETDVHDVLLVEGIRVCYPSVYQFIYNNRDLFIEDERVHKTKERKEKDKEIFDDFLKDYDESLKELLLTLFPKLGGRSLIDLGNSEQHKIVQRVHSPFYFDRYFTYSIPKNEISDVDFLNFLQLIENDELKKAIKKAKSYIDLVGETEFLRKIEHHKVQISYETLNELVLFLSTLAEYLTRRIEPFGTMGPIRKATTLISDHIKNLPANEGFDLAKNSLNSSTNILLTAEIGRSLHKANNKTALFTDKQHQELIELVAQVIGEDAIDNGAFYLRNDVKRESPLLFNLWTYSPNKGEVEKFIIDSFEQDPDKVISFIQAFTPTIGTQINHLYGPFEADEYFKIKRLVSPKIIYEILFQKYSSFMSGSSELNNFAKTSPIEERLANNFAYFYLSDKD